MPTLAAGREGRPTWPSGSSDLPCFLRGPSCLSSPGSGGVWKENACQQRTSQKGAGAFHMGPEPAWQAAIFPSQTSANACPSSSSSSPENNQRMPGSPSHLCSKGPCTGPGTSSCVRNGDNFTPTSRQLCLQGCGLQDVVNLGAGTEERKGRWKEEPS